MTDAADRSARRPVVVVHGLWMPGAETLLLRRRLAAAGFAPSLFRYPTVRATLAENARALAAHVDALAAPAVDLVGYSLGGIVVLTMLATLRPAHDGRVVCLGTPLAGSEAARRLMRVPGGRYILGRSMREHVARGAFDGWHGAQAVGVIAGCLPLSFGRLLGRLPGPNDGTVAVAETRMAGLAGHCVLPVSHTALMFSRAAARETIHFLRHAGFSGAAAPPAANGC